MRKKIRQPFKYGNYILEYRECKDGLLKILKEKLETLDEAQNAKERLLLLGYIDITIREVG